MGGEQGGGWQYHRQLVEKRIAEGGDWEEPHLRRERVPSGGKTGAKWSEAKWSEAAGESGRSTGCPWERGEGGSRGEEGGQGGWRGMWRDERGRNWRVWGAGEFQEAGGDECHRRYFEGKFPISTANEKE